MDALLKKEIEERLQSLRLEQIRGLIRQFLYGEYDSSNQLEELIQQFKKYITENGLEKIFMENFHKNCLPICILLEQNLVKQNGTIAFCFLVSITVLVSLQKMKIQELSEFKTAFSRKLDEIYEIDIDNLIFILQHLPPDLSGLFASSRSTKTCSSCHNPCYTDDAFTDLKNAFDFGTCLCPECFLKEQEFTGRRLFLK
jgi:hypothetical protein